MGSMSASDAVPLPRRGEVFFDVRGSARSMRLSWYAETGVAVFSIWQAGTCTGTFRLPMGELDRMIEMLRRGPAVLPLAGAAATDFSEPQALGAWADQEASPPDYEDDDEHRDYPPSIGPYPVSIGPLEYTGEHTQAHYLPDAAGPGYGPASASAAAISGAYNGETVPGRGHRGRPSGSFPSDQPDGP